MPRPCPTLSVTLLTIALGILAAARAAGPAPAAPAQPNILLILADDLGYGDMSAYGCREFATPHLDRLAADGMRFTAGYVAAPICGPSRAGLLTGRHPNRILPFFGNPPPGSKVGLPLELRTMADYLKAAGYRTGALGKWHLGETEAHHPLARGFDEFYGFLAGMHSYLQTDDPRWGPIVRGRQREELKQYLTFALADEACAFLGRERREPFFLYLAFNAPHVPMEAPADYLAKTAHLPDPMRRINAAMVLALDDAVGRVLAALRASGQEGRTMVIFLSDNGAALVKGSAENGGSNAPLRGSKIQVWEGGVRVPFFIAWPGSIAAGGVTPDPVSALDLLPTVLAAAGVTVQPQWQLEGVNLLPWLQGRSGPPPRGPLFWKFRPNQFAIRDGDRKLVRMGEEHGLFNVREDLSESKDLSATSPAVAKELERVWRNWEKGNMSAGTMGKQP